MFFRNSEDAMSQKPENSGLPSCDELLAFVVAAAFKEVELASDFVQCASALDRITKIGLALLPYERAKLTPDYEKLQEEIKAIQAAVQPKRLSVVKK